MKKIEKDIEVETKQETKKQRKRERNNYTKLPPNNILDTPPHLFIDLGKGNSKQKKTANQISRALCLPSKVTREKGSIQRCGYGLRIKGSEFDSREKKN